MTKLQELDLFYGILHYNHFREFEHVSGKLAELLGDLIAENMILYFLNRGGEIHRDW